LSKGELTMPTIVVYYRVSTDKQQRSGLGIEAQKAALRQYIDRTGAESIGSYTETESGKRSDRPRFARAVAHAKRSRATLVVAKLDRLARNLAFLDELQRSRLNFVALDCEHANKAMLQMMMVMAEWEGDQVSVRTKAALAARRERGELLGAENPACRNLTRAAMKAGRVAGADANRAKADDAYADILPDMTAWRGQSVTLAGIAERLNADGHTTRTGKPWSPGTVANVLRRA
jgi:DNA invertase Pin-like site-specific DNA recombinase